MEVNRSKVIQDATSGNGLAAATDLEAGDVIIEIANPYILVVEQASQGGVCSRCLLENDNLKRCPRCEVARYCSKSCQKYDWDAIHQLECKVLKKIKPKVPPTPVRALLQVLLTHKFGSAPDPRWRDLKSNQDYFSQARMSDIVLQAAAACKFAGFPSDMASMNLAVGILCRVSPRLAIKRGITP
jgi:SET and MYND domain-containing protein